MCRRSQSVYERPEFEDGTVGHGDRSDQCIGCDACVVACQSENNIPMVGKDEVIRGRRWTGRHRPLLSRGDPEGDVTFVNQPMMCQHCEIAPLRAGLPGQRYGARRGGTQRDGLQPLHRHAVLLEQLPLQGAPLQLLRLQQGYPARMATHRSTGIRSPSRPGLSRPQALPAAPGRTGEDAEEPGRHGPHARRDGEVHLLRPSAIAQARLTENPGRQPPSRSLWPMAKYEPLANKLVLPKPLCLATSVTTHRKSRTYLMTGELPRGGGTWDTTRGPCTCATTHHHPRHATGVPDHRRGPRLPARRGDAAHLQMARAKSRSARKDRSCIE